MIRIAALALAAAELGCLLEPDPPRPPPPGPASTRLAAGATHACWIDDVTQLFCWGNDRASQLGDGGDATEQPTPIKIGAGWSYVSARRDASCGIHDGELQCWGTDGTDVRQQPTRIVVPGELVPTRVEVGDGGTCAFDAGGVAYCWGDSALGFAPVATRLDIPGSATPWLTIQARGSYACAIDGANQLWCWGDNSQMQFGAMTAMPTVPINMAVMVPGTFTALAAGGAASCAIDTNNQLVCWGSANFDHATATASVVDRVHVWTQIALAGTHACGIADGVVYCFGTDESGSLGDGFAGHAEPHEVQAGMATAIVTGIEMSCAAAGSDVSCWGANEHGQLGNGELATVVTRRLVSGLPGGATSIATGADHTCVIAAGQASCWGRNHERQVLPSSSEFLVATPTGTGTGLPFGVTVVASWTHSCAQNAASATCWGSGFEIGQASPGTGPTFLAEQIAAGDHATCAVSSNVTSCRGVLPWDRTTTTTVDTTIGPTENPTAIAAGTGIIAGINGSDAFYAGDACGQPSQPTFASLGGMFTQTREVAAASFADLDTSSATGHICVIDNAGSRLVCFGANDAGQAGGPSFTCVPPSAPTEVVDPNGVGWATGPGTLSLASRHSCAIDATGELICWGANIFGELGALPSRTGPAAFDQNTDWVQIATSRHHSCGITTGGSVYCWGVNKWGELGSGPHYHETPVPVAFP